MLGKASEQGCLHFPCLGILEASAGEERHFTCSNKCLVMRAKFQCEVSGGSYAQPGYADSPL